MFLEFHTLRDLHKDVLSFVCGYIYTLIHTFTYRERERETVLQRERERETEESCKTKESCGILAMRPTTLIMANGLRTSRPPPPTTPHNSFELDMSLHLSRSLSCSLSRTCMSSALLIKSAATFKQMFQILLLVKHTHTHTFNHIKLKLIPSNITN